MKNVGIRISSKLKLCIISTRLQPNTININVASQSLTLRFLSLFESFEKRYLYNTRTFDRYKLISKDSNSYDIITNILT